MSERYPPPPSQPPTNGHSAPRPQLGALLQAGLVGPPAQSQRPPAPEPRQAPSPAQGPASTDHLGAQPGALPIPWETLTALRKQVSDAIEEEKNGRALSGEDEQQLAQSLIHRIVAQWAATWAMDHQPLSQQQTGDVRAAVFNIMYRSGPVQPYLDDPDVENIIIDGCDNVRVKYHNRPVRQVSPVADSDAALRQWVNDMAANSGHGERQLSAARPMTNFRLRDGSRVAATLLTPRPSVVIRRHRVLSATLEDLVAWGTLDPVLAAFLESCVRAKRNMLIAGDMGTGKTTLLRALGRKIPVEEQDVVTIETDRELYLDQMPDGPHVFAFEARESGGERTADGKAIGEITISDIFRGALRYDGSRVIVGEVRSVEAFPMLDAMSGGGSGSMCTLHAREPKDVLDRLLFLCNQAGLSDSAASKLVASSVDLVVYVRRYRSPDGQQQRFVSHVLETAGLGESGRPTFTEVFAPRTPDPRPVPIQAPRCLAKLVDEGGFDAGLLQYQPGTWSSGRAGEGAV